VPALVVALGLVAIAAITVLQQRSNASRGAEVTLVNASFELQQLQRAAVGASPRLGGSPERSRGMIRVGKRRIALALARLSGESAPSTMRSVQPRLATTFAALDAVFAFAATGRELDSDFDQLAGRATARQDAVDTVLGAARGEYARRASRTQTQATVGSAVVILLLLVAFGLLYRRSVLAGAMARRLADENARLLKGSRVEAVTDALTGLRRRALTADLESQSGSSTAARPVTLALFDLDGFKLYNDTFGHPAGDALLARMAGRLEEAVDGLGTAYRMGGDEFCVLASSGASDDAGLLASAARALSETGEAFDIGCSYGTALIPAEAGSPEGALRLADQRMYENKAGSFSASRQSTDVLLKVLSERTPGLSDHLSGVARMAETTAGRLGLPEHEVKRIRLAAELHDVGKVAIPTEILNKPAQLDDHEFAFIRRHTEIGERIVLAAPSLAHTAELVRSSHEWHDGRGYPDALSGDEIPLGASIIGVCDAFEAMIAGRPYRTARTADEALAELRRCSGAQFRPEVVLAFAARVEEDALLSAAA